jgi:phosphohistidine phosphatase
VADARRERLLHLVRHVDAVPAAAGMRDDDRPLSRRGEAQGRALAHEFERIGVRVDALAVSPRLRARETAALAFPEGPAPILLEVLGAGDPLATAAALRALDAERVAAVGHEPFLSALTAYLLTGSADGLAVKMGKGTVVTLTGEIIGGAMRLVALRPRPPGT